MGADGHIQYVSLAVWKANFPEVNSRDIGLYIKNICGVRIVAGYVDTNGLDWSEYGKHCLAAQEEYHRYWIDKIKKEGKDGSLIQKSIVFNYPKKHTLAEHQAALDAILSNSDYEYSKKCWEAKKWFEKNCEDWTVWT